LAKQCQGEKINWKAYVNKLAESGKFQREAFGSWLDAKPTQKEMSREEQMKTIMDSGVDLRKLVDLLRKPGASAGQGTKVVPEKEKKKGRPKGSTNAAKKRKVQDQ